MFPLKRVRLYVCSKCGLPAGKRDVGDEEEGFRGALDHAPEEFHEAAGDGGVQEDVEGPEDQAEEAVQTGVEEVRAPPGQDGEQLGPVVEEGRRRGRRHLYF